MKKLIVFAVVLSSFTTFLSAQDTNSDGHDVSIKIPEVALLDIEPANNSITLSPEAPTEAGNFLDFSNATDNSLWINYSSVVGSKSDPSRKVTVAITNGRVPEGMELYVAAAKAKSGKGKLGEPTDKVKVSSTAKEIITGIGSCYTENGEQFGHQLTYNLKLSDDAEAVKNIDFDQANTITITYTLTDN